MRHLLSLPAVFYQQRYAGEVANRSALNDKLSTLLSGELAQTAISVVMMAFYGAVMLFYDFYLALIGISFALINFLALFLVSKHRVELNMRVLSETGKTYGVAIAGLNSIETVKASGIEDDLFQKFGGYFAKSLNATQALQLSNLTLGVLPPLLLGLATVSVLALGGFRVVQGELTLGILIAFQSLTLNFLLPITDLSHLGQRLQELRGDLDRIDDVLKYPLPDAVEKRKVLDNQGSAVSRLEGRINLDEISFGHSPIAKPLFKSIDISVEPGAALALVGGSGSGKSSLARLICGDYPPWSGNIRFDGIPREEIPDELMANSLSVVDQQISLFAATIRENLTLWEPSIPEHILREACEDAAILELIDSLPDGFDTPLLEGGQNLSGGQRQRIEIARALISRPSILVLDEATSALDAETESIVMSRLQARGCTLILVAHRLSSVRTADEILVLSRGKIIERGSHEALWSADGEYASLMRAGEG